MVELTINNEAIPLNQFIANLLEAQLLASVKTFKKIPETINTLTISIKVEG